MELQSIYELSLTAFLANFMIKPHGWRTAHKTRPRFKCPHTYCSSQVIAVEYKSPPIPPCSSAMLTPSRPCLPAFSHTSLLTSPAFSHLQEQTERQTNLLKIMEMATLGTWGLCRNMTLIYSNRWHGHRPFIGSCVIAPFLLPYHCHLLLPSHLLTRPVIYTCCSHRYLIL